MREDNYIPLYMRPSADRKPLKAEVTPNRKELFAALNEFVTKRRGYLTSVPGDKEVRMECLPDSTLPDELRKLGYKVEADGEGERILHSAIVEKFVTGLDGALEPLIEGSTRLVASTVTHAGICKVTRYAFDMP
jgi:hypothetical protein